MSQRKLLLATFSLTIAAPILLFGYAFGPPAYVTGDPKDPLVAGAVATCSQSGCHTGTLVNGGAGKVQINLPGATTYVPGQAQQISVTIIDAPQRAFGFELTARLLADNTQAGNLAKVDSSTFVQCADESIKQTSCAPIFNTQFVQHTAPKSGSGSATFTFSWTPPATASGTVVLYAAGNAANGDGQNTGDHIYTTSVQLTPASSTPTPVVSGVTNGATNQATIAANTYIQIYGQNLSTTSPGRGWGSDFKTNSDGTLSMPTSLDGTSVTVGGTAAYVEYISPTQVNVVTPNVVGNNIPVVVTVNGQKSASFNVTMLPLAPSFFAWCPGTQDCGKYLIAQHSDYTNIGKVGLFPGTPASFTTPASPGETIILYGTGFGPTNPVIAAGIETDKLYPLSPTPTATLGATSATVFFGGLVPPFSQVYQFNITIPPGMASGDYPLVVNVNGTPSYSGMITVK